MSLLLRRAVEDTPLLPRDVLTAMMFNRFANAVLPDGRTLYPVTARNDVSQALDAITQTPNATLIRGAEFWEEYPLPSLGNFATLYDAAVPVGTTTIDVSGLEDHQIIVFLIDDMDPATSSRPRFRLSTDGGSSFYSTNGDYRRFADGAATGLTTAAVMTNTASTVERSAMAVLFNTPPGVRNCWLNIVRPDAGYLAASTDTITDVRFLGESSTFGITRLIVLGW
jgi:hypothetical protein